MTDARTKVRSLLLVVIMIVGTVPAAGVGSVAATTGNDAGNTPGDGPGNTPVDDPDSFIVQQNGQCYEIGTMGDGETSVEEFYDYRSNETEPRSFNYSSYGTTHLQDNQESKLFVYDGSDGYSLVALHDKYALDGGNGSNASTVTFVMSDIGDSSWAVRDDTYGDDTQDDNWDTAGNTHDIDWKWGSNRTDGGALSGVAGEEITIEPKFNEDADAWGSWDYSGDEQNRMDGWKLIDGTGDFTLEQSLDMDENVTIRAGTCSDATSPDADLTVSSNPVANGETVTLDASGSTDEDSDISEFHWDFDGDGEIDEQTDEATVDHAYDDPDDYDPSVVVVDDSHKQDAASTTVEVVDSTAPVVTVDAPDEVAADNTFELSADTRADKDVQSYEWDFGDTTKSGQQVTHSYAETGEQDVTLEWATEHGESGSETVTIQSKVGTITYLNATAVEITGTFDEVDAHVLFHAESGVGTSYGSLDTVSGTTLFDYSDHDSINGTVITKVSADKDLDDNETDLSKEHPRLDYYSEAIKPEPVNVSVENVTEAGDGTYDVTFGYENKNEEALNFSNSTLSGNASDEAPTELGSGEDTFTVTWTPDDDKEYLTWTVNRSQFGQSDLKASTPPARFLGDNGTDSAPPEAAISVPDEAPLSEPLWIDASESTDDKGVVWYKYYVNGDLLWAGNPDDTPEKTSVQPWKESQFPDGADTYRITAKVWDAGGQSDKASDTVTITPDDTKPDADIAVEGTTKVGEEVTFEATDFTEAPGTLAHVCWELNGEEGPNGETWTTTFEESGQKTVTLVLEDHAGNYNEVEKTIHVDAADSGDGSDGDDSKDGDDDPDEGGLDDDPPRGSTGGGLPPADSSDDDEQPLQDQPRNVSENLTDGDGHFGNVVVAADASGDLDIEVYATAPGGLPAPTPGEDGFEAISFLDVTGADRATVTVANDRLDDVGATPEEVTLFRHENGSWTAVETAVTNETDDAYQFSANASDGVYAVGVERPAIGVAGLTVQDERIEPGESATVAVTVENDGLAEGTHEVSLSVGGDAVATETVSIAAGEWETVRFAPTFDSGGVYELSVDDAQAELVVEGIETDATTTTESGQSDSGAADSTTDDDTSTGIPGFGVGVSLVALLAAALLALRRR